VKKIGVLNLFLKYIDVVNKFKRERILPPEKLIVKDYRDILLTALIDHENNTAGSILSPQPLFTPLNE